MSGATDAQKVVLDYYSDEAKGNHPKIALGGLKIVSFKIARQALLDQGKLMRTHDGRYRPAEPASKPKMLKNASGAGATLPDPPKDAA